MTTTAPMKPDEWIRQLKKFKVPYNELPTFRDPKSGRDDETGLRFGPMDGVGIHHTGDDAPDDLDREIIVKGRPDLPGPLAQSGLRDDGVIDLVSCGRANHFGGGDPDVLRAVRVGYPGDYPPETDKHQGEAGAVDGNDGFYGLEVYYSGGHPMTKAQYRSAVGWAAAICDFHGWDAKHVIGHREWSDYKIDPGSVDMAVFRDDVQRLLDGRHDLEGPKSLTPNVTAAIAASIRYSKALSEIRNPSLDTKRMMRVVKAQRKSLKEQERRKR